MRQLEKMKSPDHRVISKVIDLSVACSEVRVIIDDSWSSQKNPPLAWRFPRVSNISNSINRFGLYSELPSNIELAEMFRSLPGHFATIIDSGLEVVAVVDTVRSIPIFYTLIDGVLFLSNSAASLQQEQSTNRLNITAVSEFVAGGYVTGRDTLYEGLFQLQAGELIRFSKAEKTAKTFRYFRYRPRFHLEEDKNIVSRRLGETIDEIFSSICDEYRDRPIWISLSGGLDSRLLVTKLHEHGCKDLFTFSYGNPGNYEAKIAKFIANKLAIPWTYIPPKRSNVKKEDYLAELHSYWDYADGLCSMPVMGSYDAIAQIKLEKKIPKNALLINGQSGDFVSGGHIPSELLGEGISGRTLLDVIIERHFALWVDAPIQIDYDAIRCRIVTQLHISESTSLSAQQAISLYEMWEWEERQSKFVANFQRLYEWASISWALPFWDTRLISFWEGVPLKLKIDQQLYRAYLEAYNYFDLFNFAAIPTPRRWTWPTITAQMLATVISASGGDRVSQRVNKIGGYWGHYHYQYSIYGLKNLCQHIDRITSSPQARGVVALGLLKWVEHKGILRAHVETGNHGY
jgi:asparagine synthase (glutamine-hydrolysing)